MQKYIIKQKIGTGSFGQVFLAHDPKRNEKLAVKKIKIHYDNEQQVKDLVQVKILSKIRHPNVIDLKQVIYQKQTQEGSLVFEYCYTDLLQKFIIKNKERRPEIEIKMCIYEIASALSFVHSKNYIHRDLKPQNILLQQNHFQGKAIDVAKLCDFGISKRNDELPLTQYIGTRWYRAPELLIKVKNYTKAVDIFSLGCIMAQMYNLKILFNGKNSSQQLLIIMKTLGTPTKQSWPQFSNWCTFKGIIFGKYQKQQDPIIFRAKKQDLAQDLIQKMLIMNPKNRITAAEILKHPYFNDIRAEMVARQYATQPIKLNLSPQKQKSENEKQGVIAEGQKKEQLKKQSELAQSKDLKNNQNVEEKKEQQSSKTEKTEKQKNDTSFVGSKSIISPKNPQKQLAKKPPAYYSPYSSAISKQKTMQASQSSKQFDYFKTYVVGKANDDRIHTTYQLHKDLQSRNSSFKHNNLQTSKGK